MITFSLALAFELMVNIVNQEVELLIAQVKVNLEPYRWKQPTFINSNIRLNLFYHGFMYIYTYTYNKTLESSVSVQWRKLNEKEWG